MKAKKNRSTVRMFGMFECGWLVRFAIMAALCAAGLSAFSGVKGPQLVPDYDRDGKIDEFDYKRAWASEAFSVWINNDYDNEEFWFSAFGLEAPTNYVPSTQMPEQTKAIVETTFLFENPSPETDAPPEGEAQAAVRIVADDEGGCKFQYYAFAGAANGEYYLRWHDCNVGGENAREIKPEIGRSYIVRMEGFYREDARGEANTLVISVKDVQDNRDPVPQFVGNLVNKDGQPVRLLHAAGFFSVGVLEIPMTCTPGSDQTITDCHFEIPRPARR